MHDDDELKRLPRWARRPILAFLALAATGFAVFASVLLIGAIQSGTIESPSRHGHHTASRDADPPEFWIYVGFWSFVICLGISCAIAAAVATFKESRPDAGEP